jgi:nucleoside 2-deoxyribosyltransferase
VAWLARKQAICAGYGLTGVSPLDALDGEPAAWGALPAWRRIGLRNESHIRSCAAIIANLTPFRGPSADAGTVYELGFARGLGLRVFGYATVTQDFLLRTRATGPAFQDADGDWWDADGLLIEQFGLFDNLMIETALADTAGLIRDDADRWRDLTVFERCVAAASANLRQDSPAQHTVG